jgi:hypothetical protein
MRIMFPFCLRMSRSEQKVIPVEIFNYRYGVVRLAQNPAANLVLKKKDN